MGDYTIEHIRGLRDVADLYELGNREILLKYSDEELTVIYNGLGSDGFPYLVRKVLTGTNRHLEASALIHDVEWTEADGTYESFTKSNARFTSNSKKYAESKFSVLNPVRYFVIFKGKAFGDLCQKYGWAAWKTI